MPDSPRGTLRLFARSSWPEASRIAKILRKETIGGLLLLVATACALIWADSPWSRSYHALRDVTIGPHALHWRRCVVEPADVLNPRRVRGQIAWASSVNAAATRVVGGASSPSS
jgi:hypothetical protein